MVETKSYRYFIGGIILCLLGAICFSTKAIFVKLAYRETQVDPITLLALRMIFSLPFLSPQRGGRLLKAAMSGLHGNNGLLSRQLVALDTMSAVC
jgi:drug/metabolite transporter (DMT)-like permease